MKTSKAQWRPRGSMPRQNNKNFPTPRCFASERQPPHHPLRLPPHSVTTPFFQPPPHTGRYKKKHDVPHALRVRPRRQHVLARGAPLPGRVRDRGHQGALFVCVWEGGRRERGRRSFFGGRQHDPDAHRRFLFRHPFTHSSAPPPSASRPKKASSWWPRSG